MRIMMSVVLIFALSGCSVYKASTQPGPADLDGLGIGTDRARFIAQLGPPTFSSADGNGSTVDIYEFHSGLHQASKARVILYLAADVFTLGLAELVLWPIELTVMEKAACIGQATYDNTMKAAHWSVTKKDSEGGAQAC